MRTITLSFIIFFSCLVGAGQTPDEFKQRYGAPDDKGHYFARTGIVLSLIYSKDQKLSNIIIEPGDLHITNSPDLERDSSAKAMPSDIAHQVVDEIVPMEKRGKPESFSAVIESGCITIAPVDYEFVTIGFVKRCREQGGGTFKIDIKLKNK